MTFVSALIDGSQPLFFTKTDETLHELSGRLLNSRLFGAIVLDADRDVIGVITEHDIVREAFLRDLHLTQITVGQAMAVKVIMCQPATELSEALALMAKHSIRHLVVKGGSDVLGFVSIKDILHKLHVDEQLENCVLRDMVRARLIAATS